MNTEKTNRPESGHWSYRTVKALGSRTIALLFVASLIFLASVALFAISKDYELWVPRTKKLNLGGTEGLED